MVEDARPTVVVLDDREIVALGLRAIVAAALEPGGGASPGAGPSTIVLVGRTACPLADVRSALESGHRVLVLLDDAGQITQVAAALAADASGVVTLDQDVADVAEAIARVGAGERVVASCVASRLREQAVLCDLFSPREVQALLLYASGLPAKLVARRMGVATGTAKTFLQRVRAKARRAGLPADTKLDLVELAQRLGLG